MAVEEDTGTGWRNLPGRVREYLRNLFDLQFKQLLTPRMLPTLFLLAIVASGIWTAAYVAEGFGIGLYQGLLRLLLLGPAAFLTLVTWRASPWSCAWRSSASRSTPAAWRGIPRILPAACRASPSGRAGASAATPSSSLPLRSSVRAAHHSPKPPEEPAGTVPAIAVQPAALVFIDYCALPPARR